MKLVPYAHAYRQNSVQTASPGQLILMLFDGALRFMNRALEGFEETQVAARNEAIHINLVKTQAILDELQNSLDHSADGSLARTLADLYDFMRGQLRLANVRKDSAPVRVVVELLSDIRGAWSMMLAQTENQASAPVAWAATAA
jgi:flagellar protein FliS